MITELTTEQIAKFPEYIKTWTTKGLTTRRRTIEDAIIDFRNFQKYILKKENLAPVVILDSPSQCWMAVNMVKTLFQPNQSDSQVRDQVQDQVLAKVLDQVKNQVYEQINAKVNGQVQDQIWGQVRGQVLDQVKNQVDAQVRLQVRNQVYEKIYEAATRADYRVREHVQNQVSAQVSAQVKDQVSIQVRTQVWNQVYSQVETQVMAQVKDQTKDFIWPYFDCQFWAGWFSYTEFFRTELNLPYSNDYDYFLNCQEYGMVFPLDELCIVCQPPTEIHKNINGLHNEFGLALTYNGDNEIYALNGVSMDKKYVITKAQDIPAEWVMKETNVEIRRELLRKVGIERLLTDLPHKLLETRGNYELYSIDLSEEIKDARYLKMTNPSIGCFHLEGLDPSINTIGEALKWRNQNLFENAEVLT